MATEIAWLVGGVLLGAVVIWLLLKRQGGETMQTGQVVAKLQQDMTMHLDRVTQQIDQRLRDNVRAVNESKSFLADRVSATERTVREVSTGLGKLEQATTALQRTSDEIANFHQLLKSPKIRGSFGEVLLGNLLADVLPADRYMTQYAMAGSGEIADAVIKLHDGYLVAIDAKFPLANYQLYAEESDRDQRQVLRKLFNRDVKKHISDISRKYISPQERTLDFAFMYMPLEGVYYETMVQDAEGESLWDFCLQHKVIPVSPNSFLGYLQTILVGLRGMRVQEQAREILQNIGQLRRDFGQFSEDFTTVGKHLTNAKNRFDDSARRLDKFSNRLEQIDTTSAVELPLEVPPPDSNNEPV